MLQNYIFKSLLLVLLFTTLQANAQIRIGLRVAPHLTWAISDNKNTKSNAARINASYGLMLDYYFTDNYALATELSIQSYGTNLILDKSRFTSVTHNNIVYNNGVNLTYDYRMQYFQIPVLIKMRTKELGYNRFYGEFGFAASLLTRAKADIQYGSFKIENSNINEPDAEDVFSIQGANTFEDKVSSFRGSMIIGAGIQRNFYGNSMFTAGLRYENGLSGYTADEKWKTRLHYIALNLGILF
jgi:hypothetical protein